MAILLTGLPRSAIIADMMKWQSSFDIVFKRLDLARSEVLRRFDSFDPAEWSIVVGSPKWEVHSDRIVGGGPDVTTHGQIFCATPVAGDIVMEFDARIIPPCDHDLVWFWNTRLDAKPWGVGYLGCLGGWFSDMAGIEKLPDCGVSAIAPSFRTEPGRTYHIVSGSVGATHFIFVDGALATYFSDTAYPKDGPGHFGFGIYESWAEYSNLIVYRPFCTPLHPSYRKKGQTP